MPLNGPQKVHYYRRFPALLRSDEAYMGLDALGHGILTCILDHQCVNGSVPADPVALAGIVRATPEQVRQFLSTFTKLKTLETLEGGPGDRLVNPFLHRELKAIHALIEARRQAGSKGGQKTQAKARPAQARDRQASSSAQAELEASLEPPSSRQEQEQETDKAQIQKDSSRQQRIHLGVNGHQVSIADAADGITSLPEDIREGLSRLGIAANLGPDLCDKAGGTGGLRAALEILDAKVQQKEIHSPSGFFLRCVEELAREGQALYDEAHEEATRNHRKALADRRWVQLPEACRESLEVLRAWCAWWTLQERLSSVSSAMREDLSSEAWDARTAFIETCLRHHPQRTEFLAVIAERQRTTGSISESPSMAKRLRIAALGNLLGLDEKAPDGPKPTPLNGVAS